MLITAITGHTGVLLPLVVQVLHGASPLYAGYFQSVLAVSWTGCALLSARFEGDVVRRVILLGPLLVLGGVLGQAFLVVQGPLVLLACSVAMTGAGMGLAFAHVSNWTMAAARADEAKVTASSIPTMSFLGRGFGAASAGLVANTAGLGAGVSVETVAAGATWVYGVAVVMPVLIVLLSLRLLVCHRRTPHDQSNSQT